MESGRPKKSTKTEWDHEFDVLRRENLFRNPPTDRSAYPALQEAVDPHIEAFNRLFPRDGSASAVHRNADIPPQKRCLISHALEDIGEKLFLDGKPSDAGPDGLQGLANRNVLSIRYKEVTLSKPVVPFANKHVQRREVFPSDARETHSTYRGRLTATFQYSVNGEDWKEFTRDFGLLPVMVKSNRCYLQGMAPAELVAHKEESEELGGYFIVNGIEKVIRLLQVNKRNFPLGINRPSFAKRGAGYSTWAVTIRCARPDETTQSNVLHYLKNGSIIFRFSWRKNEYLVPVMMILKALIETNDRAILEALAGPVGSDGLNNTLLMQQLEIMMRTYMAAYPIYTRSQTRSYLGEKFRVVLGVPDIMSNYDAGTEFLRKIVLVHLGNVNVTEQQDYDKFKMLIFMMRKLYALAKGDCAADNPDTLQNSEILLGSFLYGMTLKERLEEFLTRSLRESLRHYMTRFPSRKFTSAEFKRDFPSVIFSRTSENLGNLLEYFLSTGNLASPSGLDLQQTAGFTVVAEKLNFLRFISHFRMVHRGAFFAELKTTAVRKLLPESWGFMCPVHTPDGAPCGLLNHLAHKCTIMTEGLDVSQLERLALELGVMEASTSDFRAFVPVILDGRVLGYCRPQEARRIGDSFRYWKVEGSNGVPLHLEIGYVPPSNGGSYPGIFMSSRPARMMRPVKYLPLDKEDFVGPHEQVYMSIAVKEEEIISGSSTHVEFSPTDILSIVANMTPFSDFNQSPRNMYQCQMGKQTMGTPGAAIACRTDNKMYRLQTGQTPIVRSHLHNTYGFDNFPNGMNAVVAVISYTGYDMDDAMVVNKSAHERGFGYGTIYKTKKITLKDDSRQRSVKSTEKLFGFAPSSHVKGVHREMIDEDGLPHVGRLVREGDPLVAWHTVTPDYNGKLINVDGITHFERYKDHEDAFVEEVRLIADENGREPLQTVSIKLRIPRRPVVGDKFSSRHGQKGVMSMRWPSIDMPFSESGIEPDIIINPHAFPSRMTIGMFVESLAGKSGALHGLAQDSTPFRFDEENTAADYFGEQLRIAGYNFHGNEAMYSGITGEELSADIFMGVVYYQRLRHMVNDKFQVRTTGPVVKTTLQPVKGRKRNGGVRVGEMERDSLLSHGAAFLLQDRLLNCSDYTRSWVCRKCGSFLSVQPVVSPFAGQRKSVNTVRCRGCALRITDADMEEDEKGRKTVLAQEVEGEIWEDAQGNRFVGGDQTTELAIPGVLRYLDVELAAMGVKLKFKISKDDIPRKGPERPMDMKNLELRQRSTKKPNDAGRHLPG